MVQWLITMVSVRPLRIGLWDPFHSWPFYGLYMRVTNHLYTSPGMILQVRIWRFQVTGDTGTGDPVPGTCRGKTKKSKSLLFFGSGPIADS